MAVSSEQYRDALRLFPSGVTLVTVRTAEGAVHGLTVSAFASVSPEPPLIAVILDHRHQSHQMLAREGSVFAVNILREDQEDLSNRFAWTKDEDRFAEGDWTPGPLGAPVLNDALAWLACSVHSHHRAGTHTIYVGHVEEAHSIPDDASETSARPLIYWNRGYRHLR